MPPERIARVKICGITSGEDAQVAVRCGADALGFVFYPGSPRCVRPQDVKRIVAGLPPFVTTVGLFVNEEPGRVAKILDMCGLDVAQLHGDEAPATCALPPYRVIKAFRVQDQSSLSILPAYDVSAFLLDSYVAGSYGGTGQRFNWDIAAEAASRYPVILAGGLTPENVAAAVERVRPYAVDVSSGVECSPGRKDPDKVAAFVRSAKKRTD
nr:phosphoribosylanthranilate isomerase [Desulfuromonas sp. AOP6]